MNIAQFPEDKKIQQSYFLFFTKIGWLTTTGISLVISIPLYLQFFKVNPIFGVTFISDLMAFFSVVGTVWLLLVLGWVYMNSGVHISDHFQKPDNIKLEVKGGDVYIDTKIYSLAESQVHKYKSGYILKAKGGRILYVDAIKNPEAAVVFGELLS